MLALFLMIVGATVFLFAYAIFCSYITDKLLKKQQAEWDYIKKLLIEAGEGEQEIREAYVQYIFSIDGYIPHI